MTGFLRFEVVLTLQRRFGVEHRDDKLLHLSVLRTDSSESVSLFVLRLGQQVGAWGW